MGCLDPSVVHGVVDEALEASARSAAHAHLATCAPCRARVETERATRTTADPLGVTTAASVGGTAALDPLAATIGSIAPLDPLAATIAPASRDRQAEDEDPDPLAATAASMKGRPTVADPTRPVRIAGRVQIGRSLGRYRILERLGAGAMGVVFRAEDSELERAVALKQLHRPDAELTGRLIREARSMAQVNHPNVVAVYDVGTTDGVAYIAMELVEGQVLRTWQRGRTVPEIVEAYVAAGRGLAAAHAAGVIHRDFKPDNVLVGGDGRVRVTDFGLAAARDGDHERRPEASMMSDVNLTTSGSVLGTPAYMAPEQFAGDHVDSRTDQFNFCVALYEALHGQRPFEGKTFEELGANVAEGRLRPTPPATRISRGLRAVVERGLSPRPGDRFPTMDHLLIQLGRDRARPWRRTAIAAAAIAAVLAVGLVVDRVVRDRAAAQIRQSFAATAIQADRAVRLVTDQFDAISNLIYLFPIMRDVAAHHDQADFGLGTVEDDDAALERLHAQLASADWSLARRFGGRDQGTILAVADYKARLLYTSAAPETWRADLSSLPWIATAAAAGASNSMTLTRYDQPALVATGLVGTAPPPGLAIVFTRTLVLGEARSQLLQIVEARSLLDQIQLGDGTMLAIVAPDGTAVGEVVDHGRDGHDVDVRPLVGFDGQPIGQLVMAQRADGVLSLFPGARLVFTLLLIGALGLAGVAAVRARRITGARPG